MKVEFLNNLLFLNIIEYEILVPPLFVIEFLHRIIDVFEDYFGECTETSLKDNYVIVYEVKYCLIFLFSILYTFIDHSY